MPVTKAAKAAKSTSKKSKSATKGGVNLAPLVSALLLAGIRLSFEQNNIFPTKRKASASKSKKSRSKPVPVTI